MTQTVKPLASATLPDGAGVKVEGGRITLDEAWAPYAMGTVTLPIVEGLDLAAIDPREDQRILVHLRDGNLDEIAPEPQLFDLGLRGRTIDHVARTVSLDLASDEAMLFDICHLGTKADTSARAHEASLRGICQWALSKLPGSPSLEVGGFDADMTAQWDATNLLLNPNATTSATEWAAGVGTTIQHVNTAGHDGTPGYIRATPSGTSGAVYLTSQPSNIPASPGELFTASVYVRHGATGTAGIRLRFYDADGRILRSVGAAEVAINQAWMRHSVTAAAPANTARVSAYVTFTGGSGVAIALDKAMLTKGPWLIDYFDGYTLDTPAYTYVWDDAPDASSSTRTANPERHPDLFDWRPGQSLWDFLRPFLEAAGLRLFCDEQRKWRVIDPAQYTLNDSSVFALQTVPGVVGNTTAGTDEISRDRTEWATGVVVHFTWRDQSGITREKFDAAGTPGKVLTFERDTAPIAGAAATILARIQSRGASQTATVLTGFSARPAGFASVDLGTVPAQTGRIRRVSFDLATGLVDVATRDMEDTP